MPSILLMIYFLLQLILSFVLCFFGYSQIRTLISAYGFIAGFAVCYSLLMSTTLPALAIYVISFLAGSTISGAAYFLYRLAMFAAGAGLGIAAGAIISTALGLDLLSTLSLIIMAGLGVAAGALSIGYKRLVIILSTGGLRRAYAFGARRIYDLPVWQARESHPKEHHRFFRPSAQIFLRFSIITRLICWAPRRY